MNGGTLFVEINQNLLEDKTKLKIECIMGQKLKRRPLILSPRSFD
jgi:hypothetical protein